MESQHSDRRSHEDQESSQHRRSRHEEPPVPEGTLIQDVRDAAPATPPRAVQAGSAKVKKEKKDGKKKRKKQSNRRKERRLPVATGSRKSTRRVTQGLLPQSSRGGAQAQRKWNQKIAWKVGPRRLVSRDGLGVHKAPGRAATAMNRLHRAESAARTEVGKGQSLGKPKNIGKASSVSSVATSSKAQGAPLAMPTR